MKRRGLVAITALAMSFPVGAAEQQSEQSSGGQQQTYTPGLAVVMGLIQVSHFKGTSKNSSRQVATNLTR